MGWLAMIGAVVISVRAGSAAWFLIALGIAAGNVVSLYLWPLRPHWACKGTGRNRGSNKKRFGECRGCGGGGRKIALGARTVHRGAVTLAQKARARKKEKG